MQFVQSWDDFENNITVYIEADEKVTYAYLFVNKEFKSMVWLYNTSDTPDIPDWISGKIIRGEPCTNSSEFMASQQLLPKDPPNDLLVITNLLVTDINQVEIGIIDHDNNSVQLLAILRDDQKLGWCSNASKDNKIAKTIETAIHSGIVPCGLWDNRSEDENDYRVLELTK